jgi:hypothetical protein
MRPAFVKGNADAFFNRSVEFSELLVPSNGGLYTDVHPQVDTQISSAIWLEAKQSYERKAQKKDHETLSPRTGAFRACAWKGVLFSLLIS